MTPPYAAERSADPSVSAAYGYTSPQKSYSGPGWLRMTRRPGIACGARHAAVCSSDSIGRYDQMTTAHEEPRRQTPTERLHEVTMAAIARVPSAPEHSVTISRNAKGIAQFEVTVRGFDVLACHDEAERIFDTLSASYPYPSGV